MSKIRAAVVQAAPVGFDSQATLAKVESLLAEAARGSAQIAVLPEAFFSAYPKGLDFGARVGSRSPEGREMFRRYYDSAIDVPGAETQALAELASELKMHLVLGVIERDGGTLYCTALFFDPEQGLVGKHRKLVPTAMERLIWGQGDAATLTVVDSPLGKIGAAICWENYMPMYRSVLYGKGVQLYCAPTVDDRDVWIPSMQHIAVEGRCFVLSACQFACRADYPADFPSEYGDDPASVLIRGGSCIVSPFGEILAGPVYGEQAVLYAELDLSEIVRGKFDLDVSGHYARPDIFNLTVSPGTQPPPDELPETFSP